MTRWWAPFAVRAAALTLVAALAALAVVLPMQADAPEPRLSAYSDGALDADGWRQLLETEGYQTRAVLGSPLALATVDDPGRTVWAVLGPERPYDEVEAAAVHGFLARGGNLLLADPAGTLNPLVIDLPVRFASSPLVDERFADDVAFVVADATLGGTEYTLRLNRPSSLLLDDGFDGTVLASSSNSSYLDVDADGKIQETDVPGPFPIAVEWTGAGGGRLVLLSDVGVFLNDAIDADGYDHAAFHRALLARMLPQGGTILIDESVHAHGAHVDAFSTSARSVARAGAGQYAPWALLLVAAGLFGAVATVRTIEPWRRHEPETRHAELDLDQERVRDTARDGALRILEHSTGMRPDQLVALPEDQLRMLASDAVLVQAVTHPDALSDGDLDRLIRLIDTETQPERNP